MVDISETLAPKSQQLDNIDLTDGPRTFTVERVELRDNAEQPLWIHLAEFPRPWPPNVNMRRVLAGIWGYESDVWVGRRLTLFRDARIKFGPDVTGGTRISHASHIDKKVGVQVLASKGRYATYTVEPLAASAEPTTAQVIATCTDPDELRAMWKPASAKVRAQIEARVAVLTADPPTPDPATDEGGM